MSTTKTQTHNERKKLKRGPDNSLVVSDDDADTNLNYPTFIVVEQTNGSPIPVSVFGLHKILQCAVGKIKNFKKLRNGSILIEVADKTQADNALNMKQIVNPNDIGHPINVKASAHRSLNSSKGIIRCRDLRDSSEDEVLEALRPEGVVHVKHIMRKKGTIPEPTNTFILTFAKPTPPKSVKAVYLNLPVETYIPNPLRCYNCQKYGHGSSTCSRQAVCARCGKGDHHDHNQCHEQPHCANCSGEHSAFSRECPEWVTQQAILQIKVERNITFPEAKQYYSQTTGIGTTAKRPGTSYASVSKTTHSMSTQTDLTWPKDSKFPIPIATSTAAPQPSCSVSQHTSDSQTSTDELFLFGAVGGEPEPSCSTYTAPSSKSVSSNIPHYKPTTSSHGSSSNITHSLSSTPKQKVQTNIQKPGPASSKQSLGNKPAKGSNDPISLFNRFGSLDSMDTDLSPGKGPGGRKNR